MSMFENVKALQLKARKEKSVIGIALYSCIIGDAVKVATLKEKRDPTDEEMLQVIKKLKVGIEQTISYLQDHGQAGADMKYEIELELLTDLLPKQMSEAEIRCVLVNLRAQTDKPFGMGEMMAHLKSTYPGQYDGSVASKVARNLLSMG